MQKPSESSKHPKKIGSFLKNLWYAIPIITALWTTPSCNSNTKDNSKKPYTHTIPDTIKDESKTISIEMDIPILETINGVEYVKKNDNIYVVEHIVNHNNWAKSIAIDEKANANYSLFEYGSPEKQIIIFSYTESEKYIIAKEWYAFWPFEKLETFDNSMLKVTIKDKKWLISYDEKSNERYYKIPCDYNSIELDSEYISTKKWNVQDVYTKEWKILYKDMVEHITTPHGELIKKSNNKYDLYNDYNHNIVLSDIDKLLISIIKNDNSFIYIKDGKYMYYELFQWSIELPKQISFIIPNRDEISTSFCDDNWNIWDREVNDKWETTDKWEKIWNLKSEWRYNWFESLNSKSKEWVFSHGVISKYVSFDESKENLHLQRKYEGPSYWWEMQKQEITCPFVRQISENEYVYLYTVNWASWKKIQSAKEVNEWLKKHIWDYTFMYKWQSLSENPSIPLPKWSEIEIVVTYN